MDTQPLIRELNRTSVTEKSCVVALVNRSYRGVGNWTTEKDYISGPRITAKRLDEYLSDPKMTIIVAIIDKQIIGCVKTGVTDSTVVGKLDKQFGYFGLFAVHPEFSGRGFGNMLLQAAELHCKKMDMTLMMADVLHIRHDIIAYYKRKGYQIVPNMSISANQVLKDAGEHILTDDELYFIVLSKSLV